MRVDSPPAFARRRWLAAALALGAQPARALMAGVAPDSPRRRLDAIVATSAHACVASVMSPRGVFSAVCISPTHALTAGHVAHAGDDLTLVLNVDRDLSHRMAVRRVMRHPLMARGLDPARPVGDLAVLELAQAIPAAVLLPPLATTPLSAGQRIELVGYGASGPGDRGLTVPANPALRRSGANRIGRVLLGTEPPHRPLIYMFSFDAPSAAPHRLGNLVETGLATGDSGSAAFVLENGRLALAGINSFVGTHAAGEKPRYTFGTASGGQVLASHREWLLSVLGSGVWAGLG